MSKQETKTSEKTFLTKGGELLVESAISEKEQKEINDLYSHAQKIQDDPTKNEASYVAILKSVKGSEKAKRLAAQFIPKFFKYYPKHSHDAINAQLDLCEEDIKEVRIGAIKGLPFLCKDTEENVKNVGQIANSLGQLLSLDDSKELEIVNWALLELLNFDAKASLQSLFQFIASSVKDEAILREKALEFLINKVLTVPNFINSKDEIDKLIDTEIRKLVPGSNLIEFPKFIKILSELKMNQTQDAQKSLFQLSVTKSGINDKFNVGDAASLRNLFSFLSGISWLFKVTPSSPFFNFLMKNVLPVFEKLEDKDKYQFLKTVAEISSFTTTSDARAHLSTFYTFSLKFLPTPPKEGDQDPNFNFSFIECVLYTFHRLAHKSPGSLNPVCGILIHTGQPQDIDFGDYSKLFTDLKERLEYVKKQSSRLKDDSHKQRKSGHKELKEKKDATVEQEKEWKEKYAKLTRTIKTMKHIIILASEIINKKFVEHHGGYLSWTLPPKYEKKEKKDRKDKKDKKKERKGGQKRKGDKKDEKKKKKKL